MKIFKRTLIILGFIAVLLAGTAVVIPFLFKDQLIAIVKEAANDNLNATLDFGDVQLSLLRNFPHLSFKIEDISLVGQGAFENLPLVRVRSFDLKLDLLSVLQSKKPIAIKSVRISRPEIQVLVLNNGLANYNIAKTAVEAEPSAAAPEEAVYKFNLDRYEISDGRLIYEDHAARLKILIGRLQHNGSGAFDTNLFDLKAITHIDSLTILYDDLAYLKNVEVDWATTLGVNQKEQLYAIKDNSLSVNALLIKLDGFVQLLENAMKINMNLSAPQNEFKNLLSLIPNACTQQFDQVESRGSFVLEAYSNGVYAFDHSAYPPFNLKLNIDQGYVKYPDLPLPIENIQSEIAVISPSSDFDDIRVEIPRLGWTISDRPFLGSFFLQDPISDPDFESSLKGSLDLEALSKAFPAYLDQEIGGILDMDLTMDAKMSTIEKERYDQIKLNGALNAENVRYPLDSYGYPGLYVRRANVLFSPSKATVNQFTAQAGRSDLTATGQINNLAAYFSPEKTMTGSFVVTSDYVDADEWYPAAPPASDTPVIAFEDTTRAAPQERPFDRFNIKVDLEAKKIKYTQYELEDTRAQAVVQPDLITVSNAVTRIKDSDFKAYGRIERLFEYLYEDGILGGQLMLQSNLINMNSLYAASTPETQKEELPATAYEAPLIPANIELAINTDIKELRYGEVGFWDLKGLLDIVDQSAVLQNMTARALGGDVLLSGQYDTRDPENPAFSLKYDLQQLDFVESFKKANTFRQLNPVAEFIEGKYSSSLILDGKLGKNLYPDLSSLNAQGFFETVDGMIKGFQPLQKIGNILQVKELQEAININDTRNYFELKNGFVNVQPFDLQVKDIKMNIAGRHSLTQQLDYTIKAQMPRTMLDKSGLGELAGEGLAVLEKQAQKLGIKVEQAAFVNLGIQVGGTIQKPDIKVSVLGLSNEDGEVVAQTDTSGTALGGVISEKVEQGKQRAKEEAERVIDSAKSIASEKTEAAKDSLSQKAEELKKQAEQRAKEILGQGDSTAVDSIKQALERWNPFKKKNKKNE